MHSKFHIESFEPVAIEKAQKVLDQHLKETLDFQDYFEVKKKNFKKKSFLEKLLGWFK
ncbi:hypothetical protein PGH07_00410 [Sulfurovum sp. zt1-1]|uniref:Uncharacterized protein n=1 Tax=Sulfurovum zhangzhouensis TaxID=3019067 RepID=A0ABT7QUW9_9BACT|nr:hypothetical protein [Sulfurovum zhangzhouensis]MDM5270634.1 hypothetical protein [Sulfurovum zhangzhouensis]